MPEMFADMGPIQIILAVLAIADVVIGALPNNWIKYKGLLLSIANALREWDLEQNKPTDPPPEQPTMRS